MLHRLGQIAMMEPAAIRHLQTRRIASRDLQCRDRDIRRVDARIGLRGNRAGDRAGAGADVEYGGGCAADKRKRFVDEMFGFGSGNQDALIDDELAAVKSGRPHEIRRRHAGIASLAK